MRDRNAEIAVCQAQLDAADAAIAQIDAVRGQLDQLNAIAAAAAFLLS